MKKLILLGLLLFSSDLLAQQITLTNAGGNTPGCLNILTVDGAAATGSLCFGGFFGENPYGLDIAYGNTTIEGCTFTSSSMVSTGTRTFTKTTQIACPASSNTNDVAYSGTTVQQESEVPRSCGRYTCWAVVDNGGKTTLTPE